jgi:methylenetetrahydrofolate reductase (NADPH)
MSGIKPARRWQPAFSPFRKEKFSRRMLAKVELCVKGPLFGCRMCGNCLLQETAYICPMECPKGMRNGPCGGVTPERRCYVDETRKCVWDVIYQRALKTGREEMLLEVLPPLDWSKAGTETWGDVARQIRKTGTATFIKSLFSTDREKKQEIWNTVFRTVRQPSWWNGDSEYHPPAGQEQITQLEKKLRAGEFVVATEVTPQFNSDTTKLKSDIELVKPYVTAINFTDSSSARPTIVGINSMGIQNVLCITGDNPTVGPSPVSNMNFVDLDSIQMLWILRRMRDEGLYLDGRRMKNPPKLFLGAATSPFATDPVLQAIRDQKKVNAGAQFFQTNLVFEPDKLDSWLEQLYKRDVLGKVFILIGIAPLKSYKVAQYLHTKVPGVRLPENILTRMEKAGENAPEEGAQMALEIIDKVKSKKGINGIHLMTLGWEPIVRRIVTESGLLKISDNL